MLDLLGYELPAQQLCLPLTFRPQSKKAPVLYLEIWNSTKGKDMGKNTGTIRSAEIGRRWACALRKRFPANRAKLIAQAFGVEVKTAESWLAGGSPYAKHLCTAWRLFGAQIVAEVIAPGSSWESGAQADAILNDIEAKLADLGEKIVYLKGGGQ